MLPIQRKISAYNHYKGNDIKYIVIHYVGATGTAKNNVDYFYGGDRQASAHYFVDDGSIWQSVEDYNGSWGSWSPYPSGARRSKAAGVRRNASSLPAFRWICVRRDPGF